MVVPVRRGTSGSPHFFLTTNAVQNITANAGGHFMLSWLASALVLFFHGSPTHVNSGNQSHLMPSGTNHSVDLAPSPISADSSPINDGNSGPPGH